MIRRKSVIAIAVAAGLLAAPGAFAGQLSLDPTFSIDGKTRIDGTEPSSVTSLEKHGGKIFAAGIYLTAEFRTIFVARLSNAGELDTGYGVAGLSSVRSGADSLYGVGLDVDDIGGVAVVGQSASRVAVARLTSSGERDTTFSGDGVVYLRNPGTRLSFDPDVAIDSAGRLVVGTTVVRHRGFDVNLYRLLPNGDRDESFGRNGVRSFDFGARDWMDALAVDDRDRVILGTDTESTENPNAATRVIRLRQNGAYDPNFSEDGVMRVRLRQGTVTVPVAIGVRVNGVITAALTNGSDSYGVARVRADGELKRSYGDNGVLGLTCDCRVLEGDIVNGRVVLAGDRGDATTLVTRIAQDGSSISQGWLDLFPAVKNEDVQAVTFDGSQTVLGGSAFHTAYLARTE